MDTTTTIDSRESAAPRTLTLGLAAVAAMACGNPLPPFQVAPGEVIGLAVTSEGQPVLHRGDGVYERTDEGWVARVAEPLGDRARVVVTPASTIWVLERSDPPAPLRRVDPSGETTSFPASLGAVSVDGIAPDDAWVLGGAGQSEIFHWDGDAMRYMAPQRAERLPPDLLAFEGGVWMIGSTLQRFDAPDRLTTFSARGITADLVTGDREGRLFAYVGSGGGPPALLEIEGSTVTPLPLPDLGSPPRVSHLLGTARDDLWIVAARDWGNQRQYWHFDGVGWSKQFFTSSAPTHVAAGRRAQMFAVARWDGETRLYELDAHRTGGDAVPSAPVALDVQTSTLGGPPRPGSSRPDLRCLGTRTRPSGGLRTDVTPLLGQPYGRDLVLPESLQISFADSPHPCIDCVDVEVGAPLAIDLPTWVGFELVSAERWILGHHIEALGPALWLPLPTAVPRRAGRTHLFGRSKDCRTGTLTGEVRVFDEAGARLEERLVADGFDATIRYGWGSIENVDREAGPARRGWFEILDVPVPEGGRTVRVEIWAPVNEGDPLERVACEEVPLVAHSDTVFDIGPLRADAPASCR